MALANRVRSVFRNIGCLLRFKCGVLVQVSYGSRGHPSSSREVRLLHLAHAAIPGRRRRCSSSAIRMRRASTISRACVRPSSGSSATCVSISPLMRLVIARRCMTLCRRPLVPSRSLPYVLDAAVVRQHGTVFFPPPRTGSAHVVQLRSIRVPGGDRQLMPKPLDAQAPGRNARCGSRKSQVD